MSTTKIAQQTFGMSNNSLYITFAAGTPNYNYQTTKYYGSERITRQAALYDDNVSKQ